MNSSASPGMAEYAAQADNSLANMGSATSNVLYGPYWAEASSAPYRKFKGWMTEGGIRVPAFVAQPPRRSQGSAAAKRDAVKAGRSNDA